MTDRKFIVFGFWFIFGAVVTFAPLEKIGRFAIMLSAAPLYALAYWNEWVPGKKQDNEK